MSNAALSWVHDTKVMLMMKARERQRADLSGSAGRFFGPDGPKKGLQKTLAQEIRQEVRTLMGPLAAEALDFEALETALRRPVLEWAARTVEAQLNQDHSDARPSHHCSCGGTARYAGRRTKRFVTVLGPIRLERAYNHCGECGHGFF